MAELGIGQGDLKCFSRTLREVVFGGSQGSAWDGGESWDPTLDGGGSRDSALRGRGSWG